MGRLKLKPASGFKSRKSQLRDDIARLEGKLDRVRDRREISDAEIAELENQLEENNEERAAGRGRLSGFDQFRLDLHEARLKLRR